MSSQGGRAHGGGGRCAVAVVGAGPAGAAAALALRRRRPELDVVVVDRAPPGRDKVCGDGIGPETRRWLDSLGQDGLLRPEERVAGFRVVVPSGASLGGSSPEPGFVVPRRVFDARMLGAARAAGAGFVQAEVVGVQQDRDWARLELRDGSALLARHVIGADGANSATRRAAGVAPNRGRHMAVAVRGYVHRPPGFDRFLLRWDPTGGSLSYGWAFPTADGRVNIGYGATTDRAPGGRRRLAARCLQLLQSAAPGLISGDVTFSGHRLPLASQRPSVAQGRVLLAGDAASLVNPLSGEGVCYAVASGVLAGTAVAASADDPRDHAAGRLYARLLHHRFGRHFRQASLAYRLLASSPLGSSALDAAVRGAARDERLLRALLGLTLGAGVLSFGDVLRFTSGLVGGSRFPRRLSAAATAKAPDGGRGAHGPHGSEGVEP